MLKKLSLQVAVGALLGALLVAPVWAQPPSIRLLTQRHADLQALREALQMRLMACRTALQARGEAVADIALPSDAVLAQLLTETSEQLFDGRLSARFDTASQVWPDQDQGCRLRLRRLHAAEVAELCGQHLQGSSMAAAGSAQAPTRELHEVAPQAGAEACGSRPDELELPAGAVLERSALDRECVWVPALGDADLQHCLYAEMPRYPVRTALSGQGLLVLRTAPRGNAADPVLMAERNHGRSEAVRLEQGLGLPAEQFTRAALERHLNQPVWADLH